MIRTSTIMVFLLALVAMSCGHESVSVTKAESTSNLPINVMLDDSGPATILCISIVKTATALSVFATQGTASTPIQMTDAGKTLDGHHIFRSLVAFAPTADMVLSVSAVADAKYDRRVKFVKNVADDAITGTVPEFGGAGRKFTIAGSANDGLMTPRDLKFNPKVPDELWTVNSASEGVVIYQNAGSASQRVLSLHDAHADHFMSKVSSLSFGPDGNFASCQESRNEKGSAMNFMGPTLWTSDLNIFAKVNQNTVGGGQCDGSSNPSGALLGSHLDMLHQSPLCVGIVHIAANQYWAFDGASNNLVFYDFVKDHGPGRTDHSDGRIRRYQDVKLSRVAGISSHMAVNPATSMLYIANTGTGSVIRVDASTAKAVSTLSPKQEPLAEYSSYAGAQVETFAQGLRQPSGIAISGNRLFVSDYATGEIIAYNIADGKELGRVATGAKGIMGLAVSPAGRLWYVDAVSNSVGRIDP